LTAAIEAECAHTYLKYRSINHKIHNHFHTI
jgi:hypothetical protein